MRSRTSGASEGMCLAWACGTSRPSNPIIVRLKSVLPAEGDDSTPAVEADRSSVTSEKHAVETAY